MDTELKLAQALSVVERLVALMCLHPDRMKCNTDIGASTVKIQIVVANRSDSMRVVGTGGAQIGALYELTRVMFRPLEKKPEFKRIECLDEDQQDRLRFTPTADWGERNLYSIITDLCSLAFDNAEVAFYDRTGEHSTDIVITAEVKREHSRFADSLSALLKTIGNVAGRRLYLELKSKSV